MLNKENSLIELERLAEDTVEDAVIYDKPYMYEMSCFLYSGKYMTITSKMKYAYQVLDFKRNLVTNDVDIKMTNTLKTTAERNSRLFNFIKREKKFTPLNAFGLQRRAFNDVFLKQQEVNYLTGAFVNIRNVLLNVNKYKHYYTERSNYSHMIPITKRIFYEGYSHFVNALKNMSLFTIKTYRFAREKSIFMSGFTMKFRLRKKYRYRFQKRLKRKSRRKVLRKKLLMGLYNNHYSLLSYLMKKKTIALNK